MRGENEFNFEYTELPMGSPDRDAWQDTEYLRRALGWRYRFKSSERMGKISQGEFAK